MGAPMSDTVASALTGIDSGFERMNRSANRVARLGDGNADVDLAREIVEQKVVGAEVQAGAAMVRSAEEMQGTLLDVLA